MEKPKRSRMTLAVVGPHDNIIHLWDSTEIGRRALEARFAENLGWTAKFRPAYRKRIETAFVAAVDDCLRDVHRL